MEKQLFGTDGIRGVAGQYPLDAPTVFTIGRCLGEYLRPGTRRSRVVIAQDTRESGRWIAETLAAGLLETGAEVQTPGILTTPGLAWITPAEGFSAGVMISASHNPYQDNGIKVFGPNGFKIPDTDELQVEKEIFAALEAGGGLGKEPRRAKLEPDPTLAGPYVAALRRSLPGSIEFPRRLVIDCANGAACAIAPEVFSGYGVELYLIATEPDGRNINRDCGSLHLETLQREVLRKKADLGVAFDGDADRALFVAAGGEVVNGDGVLLAASRFLKEEGRLRGNAVVGTVMSNLGLEAALDCEGLRLIRTPVGDKYVLEEMLRSGVNLGGEQSGHIIFSDLATTGDGLLTALQVLRIMAEKKKPLAELVRGFEVYPQTIRNVPVRAKVPLETLVPVMEQIRASEQSLGSSGRIVVRYSGTELLARVMVEARTAEQVEQHATAISRALQETIGVSSSAS
jgi:phosphoglucosamine mutase